MTDLFRLFHDAVTAPTPPSALDWLVDDATLSAADRLGIYRHAWLARLRGALRDLFPLTARAVGEDFDARADRWLRANPPSERSLFHIGRTFPDAFDGPARDLARIDDARRAVFDAPDDPPVSVEGLSSIPPERWPGLHLRRVGPSRVLPLDHDVATGAPEPTRVLVWRVGATAVVQHRRLDGLEIALMDELDEGGPLGPLVERLAARAGADAVAGITRTLAVAAREGWLALDGDPP